MPCREMKSQWIDFLTQCTEFPCGHTHVDVRTASTHIIKDTHTQTYMPTLFPADWLSSCLSDVFFLFQHYQLGMCVTLCVFVCACKCLECFFECVCVCAELR